MTEAAGRVAGARYANWAKAIREPFEELDAFAARVLSAKSAREVFDPAPEPRTRKTRRRTTSKARKSKR